MKESGVSILPRKPPKPEIVFSTPPPMQCLSLPPPILSRLSLSLTLKVRKIMFVSLSGLRPEKDCADDDPATTENYRHNLSSERAPHINKHVIVYK
jgi:hypothetical protein